MSRADVAVRMQEAAAVTLPSDVFGGELERGAGATAQVGSRPIPAAHACRVVTAASSVPRGESAGRPVSTTSTSTPRLRKARRRPAAASQATEPPPTIDHAGDGRGHARAPGPRSAAPRGSTCARNSSCVGMRTTVDWTCSRTDWSWRCDFRAVERVGERIPGRRASRAGRNTPPATRARGTARPCR